MIIVDNKAFVSHNIIAGKQIMYFIADILQSQTAQHKIVTRVEEKRSFSNHIFPLSILINGKLFISMF